MLEQLLEETVRQRKELREPPTPIRIEADIATLKEVADRYVKGNQFKVHDLVTPIKGTGTVNEGLPHIVVEVPDEPIRNFTCDTAFDATSNSFGRRMDVRVSCISDNAVEMFWMESCTLEPYIQ